MKKQTEKLSYIPAKKLFRSTENKIIAGIAGGIGEYFNIDPIFIRIIFVVLFFSHGSGLLIYLILWLIIPQKSQLDSEINDTVKSNFKEMKKSAHKIIDEVAEETNKYKPQYIWGVILVVLGLIFLLDNFNIISFDYIWRFWPLTLIIIGYYILTRHEK